MTSMVRPVVQVDPHLSPSAGVPIRTSVVVLVTERPHALDWIYETYHPVFRARDELFEFVFVVDRWNLALTEPLAPLIARGEPIRIYEAGYGVGESGMLDAVRSKLAGDRIVTLPAYPRILPDGLTALLDRMDRGPDLVTAQRIPERESWIGRVQRGAFHLLLRVGIGGDFKDIASGVRVLRREVLEEVPMYGDLARFLPVLAQREGFRVEELPLPQHPEDTRSRVYAPGIYVRRIIDLLGLFFLLRFTRKPLRFFGLIGSVLAGCGSILLLVMLVQRIGGRAISDRPLLLLAVLLFVTGVQAIAMGLIGEIIVHLNAGRGRREYRVAEVSRGMD